MKTKIKLVALAAGLVSLLPMTSAWAGGDSTTYYYGALKAAVSSTGGGKVYAATSNSAPSSDKYVTTNVQSAQNKSESKSMTFYAFAQADNGYEFGGWAASDGGTVASKDNPYKVSFDASSTTDGSPTVQTVYALFSKKLLAAFGITFETSDAGTYTVDGVAPVNKTGLTEATTVKLASSDPSFLNWRVNGAVVNGNPYDLTCVAATTVSAEFLTADQVAEVTTYDELTAALANDGKKKITIPSGVDITIAKGAALTVPAGKQLVVNGGLLVVGKLANDGEISGSGTIYKISYLIEQGEIKKPLQVTGEEWGNMTAKAYKPYYRVTTTTANTPTVPNTISGCASFWAVLFKGKAIKISKQSPKALKVTFNTAVAANDISTIADNADVDTVGDDYCVLLADCGITGYNDSKGRAVYSKTVDCAGKTVTMSGTGGKIAGSSALFLNGAVSISPSSENQNSAATFINCSSITLKKIKGVSPAYYFYDCGSAGALASLSFAFYNNKSDTTNYRKAYFYSGYYSYTFSSAADATDGGGHSYVYNGSFSSDPTAYLQQSASPNGLKVEGTKSPYKVVENVAAVNCVQVGSTQYASLAEAVSAVSSGGTLSLILPVTLKEKLVIPSGKRITIDLNGLNLSGGSIENSGALRFEDNSGAAQPGTLSTPVVGKAGTIDITFGNYAGIFTMEGGVLTTHNGTFASSFAATEAGGQVLLKGGHFDGAVAIPDGYCQRSGYIGQKVIGHIADASRIGDADVSYLVTGFNPNDDLGLGASDETLYVNFMQSKSGWSSRSDFVGREALWDRLAELRSIGEPIKGQAFEASIAFDRAVKSGTVCGWAEIKGSSEEMDMDQDLNSEEDYHILIPLVTGAGYTAKSFKHMFDGEDSGAWKQVHCGVENRSLANIGTTVTVKFQIRMGGQKAGYTFETERSRSYKFTGNGAIAGNTDYTSLATALTAANYSGTIRLSKDCSEVIEVGREATFTIDANNFAFTGSITAADGYEVSNDGNGIYTVSRACVAKVGNDKYYTLQSAIDAIESAGTIFLNRDSGECVTVAKEMSFTLAGESFRGAVSAVEGLVVAKDGNFYVIAKKPELPPEVQDKTEAEKEQIIQQQIQEELQKPDETVQTLKKEDVKILENAGIDVKQLDKTPISTIVAPNSTGTGDVPKMAAVLTVETSSIPSNAGNWSFGLASVKKNADGTEEPEKIVQVEENEQKVNLVVNDTNKDQGAEFNASELEQGVYKTTITVEGRTIIDPNSPEIVVQETTPVPNTTIILPIPGEASIQGKNATLDTIIDPSTLADGDEIKYYNKQSGMYDVWKYEKETDSWNEISLYGINGVEGRKVDSAELAVGTAAWFTRTGNNADGGKPIKVIGVRSERALKAKIDPPASGESASWNLIAIPTPAATFDLNLINEGVSDKDEIEVQTARGRIRFSRGADNMWGYNEVKTEEKNIGGRTMTVKKNVRVTNSSTVKTGEGIWYISAGGTPTIDWTKAEVEKR